MIRKAADKMRAHPITSATLVGGGSILGLVGVLKSLSKPEQDAVIDAAVAAEQDEGDATAYGLSSGSLLSAAVVLGMMDENKDLLKRVTTEPGMDGMRMDEIMYGDPMGDAGRADAVASGRQRIEAPAPPNVIIRRR